jgi:hypothetical protein
MIVFYILLAALCLWGFSFRKSADTDYLSINQGNAVKGLFILIVFLSHSSQVVDDTGYPFTSLADQIYWNIQGNIGQLCVVMFLFLSGYGIMYSILAKGKEYVRNIPRHRALGTWVNFAIAVLIFALVQLLAGKTYPAKQYLLALVGWESIGNSCWYIFVIILLYLSTWLSAKLVLSRGADSRRILPVNLVFVVLLFIGLQCTKEPYWYKTLFAYPLGLCFPFLKPALDKITPGRWWIAFLLSLACLAATYPKHQDPYFLVYTIRVVSFALVFVLLLRRVKFGNPVLNWLGVNLFPIFIYQRLPMLFLPAGNPYIFMPTCLAITCVIAYLYRFIRVRI